MRECSELLQVAHSAVSHQSKGLGSQLACCAALLLQRLVPEPRTFNIVMNACNAAGQFASCTAVHGRMASQKVPPTVGTYNAVILAHCK
jgi:pentatricopeptide repeat protein